MTTELGTIAEVPLKDLWQGEATHFTPWLAANLAVVGDRIGLELELVETEASAGDFSADIVAREVATGRRVIIENQFGATDHRHLGQLVTYASVLHASVVIWIAETIRREHKAAIDFLNQNLSEDLVFYAVSATLMRIDTSRPALLLDVVCGPSEASQPKAKADNESRERYRSFFQVLIDELRVQHKFTNAKLGQAQNWYTFSSENSRVYKYSAVFARGGKVRTEIYIDCGDKDRNERIFDWLSERREEIDAKFGAQLSWEKLENRTASRIAYYRDGEIDSESALLDEIRIWMVQGLLKFRDVFPAYMRQAVAASPPSDSGT